MSAKVSSFQIFMTSTSRCSAGNSSTARASACCVSVVVSNSGATGVFRVGDHDRFATGAAGILAQEIEGDGTDRREKQRAILHGVLLAPETDERFLDDILRVGAGAHELPRKEDKPGRSFSEANFPVFMSGDIFHDLDRVFHNRTPPLRNLSNPRRVSWSRDAISTAGIINNALLGNALPGIMSC